MSPTSYQTAPSRVCVAAFYREMAGCQWLVLKKCFFFNWLAPPLMSFFGSDACMAGLSSFFDHASGTFHCFSRRPFDHWMLLAGTNEILLSH
ncbi:hypothetical protein B5U27_08485 [Pseudomonas amygdali pv. lachrymans]|nr:hypothetical protein B5U27_08485 [Pseudomonas amygdali pv. lachrymans]PWD03290.1 hypothetical protein CX658_13290 [Pseudomonas amygdali pv. lachrymans]QOI03859.1 hypothetical protein D5S10_08215 [Pseudomonas savastanoi]